MPYRVCPVTGTYRQFNDDGTMTADGGPYSFHSGLAAEYQSKLLKDREAAEELQRTMNDTYSKSWGSSSTSSSKLDLGGMEWVILAVVAAACYAIYVGVIATYQVLATAVLYHTTATFGLLLLAIGGTVAACFRERVFPTSERKQLLLRVFQFVTIAAALVGPIWMGINSYFYNPSPQLAAEKLNHRFYNPQNYVGLGEEGVKAVVAKMATSSDVPLKQAYEALSKIGEPGVREIERGLLAPDRFKHALTALLAVGGEGGSRVLSAVMERVPYCSAEEWSLACQFFARHPEEARQLAEATLKGGDPAHRRGAIWVLDAIGSPTASTSALIHEALRDDAGVVRQSALWALNRLTPNDEKVVAMARKFLNDPSPEVRSTAQAIVQAAQPVSLSQQLRTIRW